MVEIIRPGLNVDLPPRIYRWWVRPPGITDYYINNFIQDQVSLEEKKVLDFGCGTGSLCTIYDKDKYLGIDVNESRIGYAKKIYPEYEFKVFDGEGRLPLEDSSVDCISTVAVLHHIPDENLEELVPDFKRVLRPEGQLIAVEPCLSAEGFWSNFLMKKIDRGNHIRDKSGYFSLLEQSGFETNEITSYSKMLIYNELFFIAELE